MNPFDLIDKWNSQARTRFSDPISLMVWDACVLDVRSLKPGNVHCYADGHGMTVEDFLVSAAAISGVIASPGQTLGERICESVAATRKVAGKNTNLGIILLCAPLVHAALQGLNSAHEHLSQVIDRVDVEDSERILQAIRIAGPSGLGSVSNHDVFKPAKAPIKEIMRAAQHRDMIARQYANGYREVLEFGVGFAKALHMEEFEDDAMVTSAVFLNFLSRFPDTHIVRQFGMDIAESVQTTAGGLLSDLIGAGNIADVQEEFMRCDTRWKSTDINPGTSADLTVATLLALKIADGIRYSARGVP